MKYRITLLFALTFFAYCTGQEMKICSYTKYITEEQLTLACGTNSFLGNSDAERAVDEILQKVGLFRNFIVKECPNISNAIAVTVESPVGGLDRYIIYDKYFLDQVVSTTADNWSAISILAHEIGHHLNGHTLVSGIDSHAAELQADQFSGFVLAKMGATLEESCKAMEEFGGEYASESHPAKSDRLSVIRKGWLAGSSTTLATSLERTFPLYTFNQERVDYFVEKAIGLQNSGNYYLAGDYLTKAYQYSEGFDPKYLYYSASNYVNSRNYDEALLCYEYLVKIGFTGEEWLYTAVNKKTGERERFSTKTARDLAVKKKRYKNPEDDFSESKVPEIVKNIALIYLEKNDFGRAIASFEQAKKENANDVNLLLAEADLYYKMNDIRKYNSLIKNIIRQKPNDPVLYYNLGVSATELGEFNSAYNYYQKALELDPSMHNARINLAYTILSKENQIVEEMNSLGMSEAEEIRYNELDKMRREIYKEAIPYLESILKNDPGNHEAATTMVKIYQNLGNQSRANEIKKKYGVW